jgi:hypothetical protein
VSLGTHNGGQTTRVQIRRTHSPGTCHIYGGVTRIAGDLQQIDDSPAAHQRRLTIEYPACRS